MKKWIIIIIFVVCFLGGCSQEERQKEESFGLKAEKGDFAYGEVYKINKKNSESAILRISEDKLLFGVQDKTTQDISFYWMGMDQKVQKTKSTTISEKSGEKDAKLKLAVQGSKEFDLRNEDTIDSEGIFNFSGVYFDLYQNELSKYTVVSAELSDGNQVMGFRDDHTIENRLLATWDSVTEVLENPQASCDSIGTFGNYVYVFSKETKTIYQLTNELKVVKKYDLSSYLSKDKLGEWNTGEFIYQNELKKCIFYLKEENGESHYFDVTTDNITPWDFSNPDYKDKYAIHGPNLINLNDENADYNLKTARLSRAAGEGITENGDYYFLSSKNLTEEKPKEEDLYTRYLIKVEKDKLKDFLEEYGKKNN